MTQVSTLWPYGGPGHGYGSFAGKTEVSAVSAPSSRTWAVAQEQRVLAVDAEARVLAVERESRVLAVE